MYETKSMEVKFMKFNFFVMLGLFLLMLIIPFKFDFEKDKPILQDEKNDAQEAPIKWDLKTKIRIKDEETGEIKSYSQKDFVLGAVCSEVPPSFEEEAIKAQAIASHSYGLYCMNLRKNEDFDILAPKGKIKGFDLKKQYGNSYKEYYSKMKKCCNDVFDYGIFYDGEIALGCYHAMCAGKTVDAKEVWGKSLPYLVPVSSEGDKEENKYEEEKSFTYDEFKTLIKDRYPDILFLKSKENIIKINDFDQSGYVKSVKIGKTNITGCEIRSILSLRSSCFEVEALDDEIIFKTKGYGHGVGMSQVGANFMAKNGNTHKEILEHYFSGAKVIKIDD